MSIKYIVINTVCHISNKILTYKQQSTIEKNSQRDPQCLISALLLTELVNILIIHRITASYLQHTFNFPNFVHFQQLAKYNSPDKG